MFTEPARSNLFPVLTTTFLTMSLLLGLGSLFLSSGPPSRTWTLHLNGDAKHALRTRLAPELEQPFPDLPDDFQSLLVYSRETDTLQVRSRIDAAAFRELTLHWDAGSAPLQEPDEVNP